MKGRVAAIGSFVVAAGMATACTAGSAGTTAGNSAPASTDLSKPVTITFWSPFSADREKAAVTSVLDAFHAKYPKVTIKPTWNQDDDKITQAIRGGTAPDVVVSFSTDNVGEFCSSGAWQDLTPYLNGSHVDLNQFPTAVRDYTSYKGKRCALPLLADDYGLYYNKSMFDAAGITQPPKTISELVTDAKKLTKRDSSGKISVIGFDPTTGVYESVLSHYAPSFDAHWQTSDGKSSLSKDPGWTQMLIWLKSMTDYYGQGPLQKFNAGLGDEFSADNGFEIGKIAMMVDGEYRTAFVDSEHPELQYGTAPFPVADDKQNLYGAGYVTGTIIGIPRGAKHAAAAWQLVKFLTTDTGSLVKLANALHNVPSTIPSLSSSDLSLGDHFQPFLDIFKNPNSSTTPASPNGGAYQQTAEDFATKYLSGKVSDLQGGLAKTDTDIDNATAQATSP